MVGTGFASLRLLIGAAHGGLALALVVPLAAALQESPSPSPSPRLGHIF